MHVEERNNTRHFDIVVWGASGFTGKLVVEYLLSRYSPDAGLRWAIAGRNRQKLDAILGTLTEQDGRPPVILADSHDASSLDNMAASTKVVLAAVGPYAQYGSELVAACVRNGTDYCDLCGEVQWMRQMIDAHQSDAAKSGARIVMACGFDSIPSDFGVWYLQREAKRTRGRVCDKLTLLVRALKGGASGGTYASMLNAITEAQKDRSVARILADPYALIPADTDRGLDGRDQSGAVYHTIAKTWTGPFVMASVNTRIVRRSNSLSGHAYGKNFRYHEATMTGTGFSGWIKAAGTGMALRLFIIASAIPLLRRMLVSKMVPQPGEGPSREERENGYFNLLLLGEYADEPVLRLRIKGDRDPGYGSTSKMLAESAICLALDNVRTKGGLWTPVTAMGERLFRRLTENAGLSFEFEHDKGV